MRNNLLSLRLLYSKRLTSINSLPRTGYCSHLFFVFLLLVLLCVSIRSHANTESNWWFNIELIAFKRDIAPGNTENFDAANFDSNFSQADNLLYLAQLKRNNYAYPVMLNLPTCNTVKDQRSTATSVQSINNNQMGVQRSLRFENLNFEPFSVETQLSALAIASTEDSNIPLSDVVESPADEFTTETTNFDITQNRLAKLKTLLQNSLLTFENVTHDALRIDCVQTQAIDLLKGVNVIDRVLVSDAPYFKNSKHLLSEEELVLTELADRTFRQRDIQGLLHTSWRENVQFGEENADFVRIRAGKKLELRQELSYDQWLLTHNKENKQTRDTLSDEDDAKLLNQIKQALDEPSPVDWISLENTENELNTETLAAQTQFELDGMLKVYLDYVNQVPYLHIESEFKHHRLEVNELGVNTLAEFPFKQRRRIISKQVHYFDHPAFGIIIRLERFTPPNPNDVLNESTR